MTIGSPRTLALFAIPVASDADAQDHSGLRLRLTSARPSDGGLAGSGDQAGVKLGRPRLDQGPPAAEPALTESSLSALSRLMGRSAARELLESSTPQIEGQRD